MFFAYCDSDKAEIQLNKFEDPRWLNDFVGKEVFTLLLSDEIRFYEDFVFMDDPPMKLYGIYVDLDPEYSIEILIRDFKYVKRFRRDRNWSANLFFKERIKKLILYRNNEIVFESSRPSSSQSQLKDKKEGKVE